MSIPWDFYAATTSLLGLWLYGDKVIWGPIIGLISQIAWVGLAVSTEQYWLLLSVVAFIISHSRNLKEYWRER